MSTRHRISPSFVIEEFDCRDGSHVPANNVDDVARLVAWWLQPMRREFGAVTILSGYRSSAHNRAVGGAARSVHLLTTPLPGPVRARGSRGAAPELLLAAAADVRCARGNVARWAAWASAHRASHDHLAARGRGGIGRYPVSRFLHLDTGPLRDWNG